MSKRADKDEYFKEYSYTSNIMKCSRCSPKKNVESLPACAQFSTPMPECCLIHCTKMYYEFRGEQGIKFTVCWYKLRRAYKSILLFVLLQWLFRISHLKLWPRNYYSVHIIPQHDWEDIKYIFVVLVCFILHRIPFNSTMIIRRLLAGATQREDSRITVS